MSNSLDPDQTGHFVGPDLGPNCLQRLSADDQKMTLIGKALKVHDSSLILINNIYFLNVLNFLNNIFYTWEIILHEFKNILL